jgi:pyruvate, water dikinase
MFRYWIFFLLFVSFQMVRGQKGDYTFGIAGKSDFDILAGAPLSHNFPGMASVKLVYQLREQKLYFINSQKYPLHYGFCKEMFGESDLADFNRLNYSDNAGRNYVLATLNYFRDLPCYTLEFSYADDISQEKVEMVYNEVRRHFYDTTAFFLQLGSPSLLKVKNWKVPVIGIAELFAKQKLQVIQEGTVSGELLAINADSLKFLGDVKSCILLLRGNSNDIPLCRGIIANNFQTPLSHISILCQNRKTPLVALKGAEDNRAIASLLGEKVRFSVMADTFMIERDTTSLVSVPHQPTTRLLTIDTTSNRIVLLSGLRMKDKAAYGVKAVNLAALQRVRYKGKRILTPEGAFAIPIFYYWQHMRQCGADTLIRNLVSHYEHLSQQDIADRLVKIRDVIRGKALDAGLLQQVRQMIRTYGITDRYRFRSSSNAEDLEGFNGAGLYTSETGRAGERDHSIDKAIRKVWASLWYNRAFDERALAGIDQTRIGMAILAHRSFPDEYANGVAITRNLYRDFDFGFVVNLQPGDRSLVKPTGNETCEQLISYFNTDDQFFNDKDAVEYLSFSTLNNNQPLLNRQELFELTQQLNKIKAMFYRKLKAWKKVAYKDFAMDVEFKAMEVNGKRVFYFKQARPF